MSDVQFSNEFGEVWTDRIAFQANKSWFSGGIREDLPLKHVTSVRHEVSRKPVVGVVCALIALVALSSGGTGVLVGLVFAAIAVVMFIGSPSVTINTAGGDLRHANGGPMSGTAAEAFVSAVGTALFARPS